MNNDSEYILAIDPALSTTGYAIINKHTMNPVLIEKFVTSPKNTDDVRINAIVAKLFYIAESYNIQDVIFEDGFSGVNIKTSLQLATLRGAIIGVYLFNNYNVHHMLTTEIRKELGLGGKAKKEEVADMLISMYPNLVNDIGPYSDKQNKQKTSDMYDAFGTGIAFLKKQQRCNNG